MTYYPGGKKIKGKDISEIIYKTCKYVEENKEKVKKTLRKHNGNLVKTVLELDGDFTLSF